MIFSLRIQNVFVKNIEAKTIKEALKEVAEMDNSEVFDYSEADYLSWAYQVVDGKYYELKEFLYTITYHFFRVGNKISKEYSDKVTADYWYEHFCTDPNYSSVTKNW